MDSPINVLVEVHRLQVLAFIRQRGPNSLPFCTVWDLANRLRIDVEECCLLIEELVEDGLVEPMLASPYRLRSALRLTSIGEGYLAWLRTRSARSARAKRYRLPVPIPNAH